MGYHPETLVFSFPPYRSRISALEPYIGFDVWHIDPERPGTGNRRDDSCGWFDRTPGEYADAVKYLIDDQSFTHEIALILARKVETNAPFYQGVSERQLSWPRLTSADCLAACLMTARYLELRRWWNGQDGKSGAHASRIRRWFCRKRKVDSIAINLALDPLDNFTSLETPAQFIKLTAAALNRHFQPWWRHPRWHVHHWKIHFDLTRNIRRMFQKCGTCGGRLGFGYSPISSGGSLYHHECYGIGDRVPPEPQHDPR